MSLVILPSLVLEIGFLNDTKEDDEKDRNGTCQGSVCAHCGNRLHNCVEGEEAHYNFLVLQKERDWEECKRCVTRRFHLVRRSLLLLRTRVKFGVACQLFVDVWHYRERITHARAVTSD